MHESLTPRYRRGFIGIAVSCAAAIIATTATAQNFHTSYGLPGERVEGYDIKHTSDGGYIVAGRLSAATEQKTLVLKVDSDGDIEWDRFIGGNNEFTRGFSVVETQAGGYVVAGHTGPGGPNVGDLHIIEINSTGTVTGEFATPGGTNFVADHGSTVIEDVPGRFVVAHHVAGSQVGGPFVQAPVVLRYDANGLDWMFHYQDDFFGVDTFSAFTDIKALPNGEYLLCGYIAFGASGIKKTIVIRLNNNGTYLAGKQYAPANIDHYALGITVASNGDYLVTGFDGSVGANGAAYLMRTDSVGDVIWYRTYSGFHSAGAIHELANGDILLGGHTQPFPGEPAMMRTTSSGVPLWARAYSGSPNADLELGKSIALTPGGYALTGLVSSWAVGNLDALIVHTDTDGFSDQPSCLYSFPVTSALATPGEGPFNMTPIASANFNAISSQNVPANLLENPCSDPTGACCYDDPATGQTVCDELTFADCVALPNGIYQGNGVSCTPFPCSPSELPGACCYENAAGVIVCDELFEDKCVSILDGTFFGQGTLCIDHEDDCIPTEEFGACCYENADGVDVCDQLFYSECVDDLDGDFYPGMDCDDIDCGEKEVGACCWHDPATGQSGCDEVSPNECELFPNPIFLGFGTSCTPNPCPKPRGACCYIPAGSPSYICEEHFEGVCDDLDGIYHGDHTFCVNVTCPEDAGACCWIDFTNGTSGCVEVTANDCETYPNPIFFGLGTACTPGLCPEPPAIGACCYENADGVLVCDEMSEEECVTVLGGEFFGDGSSCTDPDVDCIDCIDPPLRMTGWWPLDESTGTTAHDLAFANHGTHFGSPTVVPGMVGNALSFNGSTDYVAVPNNVAVDVGTGDFSIDAWIRISDTSGVHPIVDKRVSGGGEVRGYMFFVLQGRLWMQLSDGTFFNYDSGVFVADGQWRHVAVTIDRASTTGGRFYLDGQIAATFNPTNRPGSLSNNSQFWIARETVQSNIYFNGEIDEVEFFQVELDPQTILELYEAGSAGKCKRRCFAQSSLAYCVNDQTQDATVLVCNDTPNPAPMQIDTFGMPAGNFGPLSCNIDGPTGFTVQGPNPITVPPFSCETVTITIDRPVDMNTLYDEGCWAVMFTNLDTGWQTRCFGSVVDRRDLCPLRGGIVIGTPVDLEDHIVIDIGNTGGGGGVIDVDWIVKPSRDNVSLDGQPGGKPISGNLSIRPDGNGSIEFSIIAIEHEPFEVTRLLVSTDTESDREFQPLIEFMVKTQPPAECPADFNADGLVNVLDLLILLEAWGPCDTGGTCTYDLTSDNEINVLDLLVLLENWGPCP